MTKDESPKGFGGWLKSKALDIVRGAVIGLANVIPGVSGGTMMVSMGIYDKIIYCINHLFSELKRSIRILLPYAVGMLLAIVVGSFALKGAFRSFPLPTNTLFIGLILGSLPMILKELKPEKDRIGVPGVLIFLLFFGLVVLQKATAAENVATLDISFGSILLFIFLGMIASATMVIPGVSGSMMLKTLGYYEPIVTETIPATITALTHGDWAALGHGVAVLLPFLIGIVVGIFAIARLIDALMKRYKGRTYCAILGMVLASPVVILMEPTIYAGMNIWIIVASVVTFLLGLLIATKLGGEPEHAKV